MHSVSRLLFLLLCATPLCAQIPYSIDGTNGPPTNEETFYLELINRARLDPAAEGERLRTTADTSVLAAVDFFNTNLELMAQEMSTLPPAPPIAFNAQLTNAARAHSLDQFTHQFQGHGGSDGRDGAARVAAAGYNFQTMGENVYATASSVFYGHAGFEIDWGNDAGGMQTGRGHRLIIHNPAIREVGIGVVLGTNGTVGPQVVTQDFGTQVIATPLLTGVAYYDLSGDNFYTPGEGLGGISVTVSNAAYSAVTTPSGAFTIPLPGDGTYHVRFNGLGFDTTTAITVANNQNVKLDLSRSFSPPAVTGPLAPTVSRISEYSIPALPGATRHDFIVYRRDAATPAEPADATARVTLDVAPNYQVLQTTIRAQGSGAFNLRTIAGSFNDQTITLNRLFFARPGAALTFSSRFAAAFPNETAHVQISTDDGLTWTSVFNQAGAGQPGEVEFTTRSVDLASFAGKTFRVRLLYAFANGSYYTDAPAIGWYVDDLKFNNCEELILHSTTDLGSATKAAFTPPSLGNFLLQFRLHNLAHPLGDSQFHLVTSTTATAPVITAQPAHQAPAIAATTSLNVQLGNPANTTYTWQRNGATVSGAASATLPLANFQPQHAGLYRAISENPSGSTTSNYAIVGLKTEEKVVGSGYEITSNTTHPNNNVFDQVLLTGVAESITSDYTENQITRTSFIDLDHDIVQVEFSGPGTLTLVLDEASDPAPPLRYNQDLAYVRGHAGIVITGATEQTNVSVFTVGRATAFDPTGNFNPGLPHSENNLPANNNNPLFAGRTAADYDGIADIAFIAISSPTGKFGGIRTSNTNYFAKSGLTGIYAPGVTLHGPLFIGDLSAYDDAEPVIIVGSVADARITGGNLAQANGAPVQVSGLTQLKFTAGSDSHGRFFDPQPNQAILRNAAGAEVTAQIVVNP